MLPPLASCRPPRPAGRAVCLPGPPRHASQFVKFMQENGRRIESGLESEPRLTAIHLRSIREAWYALDDIYSMSYAVCEDAFPSREDGSEEGASSLLRARRLGWHLSLCRSSLLTPALPPRTDNMRACAANVSPATAPASPAQHGVATGIYNPGAVAVQLSTSSEEDEESAGAATKPNLSAHGARSRPAAPPQATEAPLSAVGDPFVAPTRGQPDAELEGALRRIAQIEPTRRDRLLWTRGWVIRPDVTDVRAWMMPDSWQLLAGEPRPQGESPVKESPACATRERVPTPYPLSLSRESSSSSDAL